MNIIGFNESLGIPFKYHKHVKSIHDHIIEGVYQNLKNETDVYLNAFSMFFNKTHHIKDMLIHNMSVKDIKLLIKYGNEASRNNIFTKIGIPSSLAELDKIKEKDENLKIRDILGKGKNIILFASGVNDIMYQMNACFYTVAFDKKRRNHALHMLQKDDMITHTLENVEELFKIFLSINPNTTIFVFNFSLDLYSPNFISAVYKNWNSMKILNAFIERYNKALQNLTNKYHLVYIDHRNHYNMKKRTEELIEFISNHQSISNKVDYKFEIDESGLNGFLLEQKNLLNFYKNNKLLDKKYKEEKIKEHSLDIEIIKKIQEECYGKN